MQYAHKSSIPFFTEGWIFYQQSHDKARVVAAMLPQRSSTTNFALPGTDTQLKCEYISAAAAVSLQWRTSSVTDSAEMLLAEQASKQGCFISLHTLSTEFISCVILLEALWWLSRTLAETSASCFVNVISAPFPLFLGWLLWVLCMCRCWMWERSVLWRKHGFGFLKDSFLALDRNGWFALRSASSHCESELKEAAWNKGWFYPCAGITSELKAVCCSAAGLQHCTWAICSSGPVAVRVPW